MFKPSPLLFRPILKEQVWGGRAMSGLVKLPEGKKIGEAWFMADLEGNDSVIASGLYEGAKLSELMKKHANSILGPELEKKYNGKFPLLFKFIDSHEKLSVQVHPDDAQAIKDGKKCGKTEAWYVMGSGKGSYVDVGVKAKIGKAGLKKLAHTGKITSVLKKFRTQKGDVFFIPAGTVHSIGPANLIFEIQQNSDITYRLYDWGRSNLGVQRELHIDKGLSAIRNNPAAAKITGKSVITGRTRIRKLISCQVFGVFEVTMEKAEKYWYNVQMPVVLAVVEGEVSVDCGTGGWCFSKGSVVLLPYSMEKFGLRALKKSKVVLTEVK